MALSDPVVVARGAAPEPAFEPLAAGATAIVRFPLAKPRRLDFDMPHGGTTFRCQMLTWRKIVA
jgi:hypothetical protein